MLVVFSAADKVDDVEWFVVYWGCAWVFNHIVVSASCVGSKCEFVAVFELFERVSK